MSSQTGNESDPIEVGESFYDDCIKIKLAAFIFIMFIFLNSDVFIERVLSNKDETYVEGRQVNTKGTIIQALLLSISFILIDQLIIGGYI